MKTLTKNVTLFIADDGKEFFTKDECRNYEKTVLEDMKKIMYFCVKYCPDLTETGLFQREMYVAVYYPGNYHKEILLNWCVNVKDLEIIGESVQGYGLQPHFDIRQCTKNEFFESKYGRITGSEFFKVYDQGRFFLSPKSVEGFPENYDYIKEWSIR